MEVEDEGAPQVEGEGYPGGLVDGLLLTMWPCNLVDDDMYSDDDNFSCCYVFVIS